MFVSPVILTAAELRLAYGPQVILDGASLTIHEGDRIGLVGRNGAGKSSFLKIIAGVMSADSGDIAKRKDLVAGYLSQDFTLNENLTVLENIMSGAGRILDLLRAYEELPYDHPQKHILEEKILRLDGWNLEREIGILIKELHAPPPEADIKRLSGGEKRRVALCRALISKPDLLMLDEPTNHLDTESIEWIENYLAVYKGTCIFVTHDRYFLDSIATRIVELSHGVFYSHTGNYTDYLINKSERQAIQETEEKKRQNFLRRELDWVMRGPKARRTKAKSRLDQYYEVAAQKGPETELDVELIIPPADRLGNKILELKNCGMKISDRVLFESLNFIFEPGRKLGIVGRNGTGKTTLLKMILGQQEPFMGKADSGEKTIYNYIDQERLILNEEETVFESIGEGMEVIQFGKEKMPVWTYLRRFLFTDDRMNTKVNRLSGGERSRLLLARILKNGGNFLMFDEPTNDLDLPTLRILEEALIAFEGCLVIVSHDRYFLNRVCNGILAFEGNKYLHFSEGDYDYYVEKRKARVTEDISSPKEKKEDTRVKQKPVKLSYHEQRELNAIEEKILAAEAEAERIESLFSSPDFYEKYAAQTKELQSQLDAAKAESERLYRRWSELEMKTQQ